MIDWSFFSILCTNFFPPNMQNSKHQIHTHSALWLEHLKDTVCDILHSNTYVNTMNLLGRFKPWHRAKAGPNPRLIVATTQVWEQWIKTTRTRTTRKTVSVSGSWKTWLTRKLIKTFLMSLL